jgi:DNA helicase HerA-like ATPase
MLRKGRAGGAKDETGTGARTSRSWFGRRTEPDEEAETAKASSQHRPESARPAGRRAALIGAAGKGDQDWAEIGAGEALPPLDIVEEAAEPVAEVEPAPEEEPPAAAELSAPERKQAGRADLDFADALNGYAPDSAADPAPAPGQGAAVPKAVAVREPAPAGRPARLNGQSMLEAETSTAAASTSSGGAGPAPDATGLLGHVISIAGSVVWGLFDTKASNLVQIGGIVRLESRSGRSFGIVTTLRREGRRVEDDRRMVEIKLLGEILEGRESFQCGVSQHPALDSRIYLAERVELETIFRQPDTATVRLGSLRQAEDLPAYAMTDKLLGKHFAVLGTTGAGKSCAVTVILRAILEANPFGHVIMLDPHNEYGRAFGDKAELLNPSTLKLPYWLLNFEEISEVLVNKESQERAYAEAAILRNAILTARRQALGPDAETDFVTVDTPVPYRLSELIRIIKEEMGGFNKAESAAPYQHLIARIESVSGDKRFAFMFSSFMVQDNMVQVLAKIMRIPVGEKPVTVIDLSGMPSEIVDVVVSVLCRLVFEFALWSDRAAAPPTLLVCEEAHRYVPRDDQAGFAPTKRSISRIAKEGRKCGLSLCLVTQRPAELSVSSLSQCNTIFALRMGNEHDLNFVQHAIPESSRWLTEAMPSLNTREAVVVGAGVSVPMHIRFDELAAEHQPASTTPPFSRAWQQDVGDEEMVAATVERWRHQIRAS